MSEPGRFRQMLSVMLLPFNALVVVPGTLLWLDRGVDTRWPLEYPLLAAPRTAGFLLAVAGLSLVIWTLRLFATIGKGTLAPWDPTQKLVVEGPYRHVRNPMISGGAITLLGDVVATGSVLVLGWLTFFVALNHVYFQVSEEPGLVKRFGEDYEEYARRVPRWIPRRTAWERPAA